MDHELIVQYARDGDAVWILPGTPERKTWWRNFREPSAADLWLAGKHLEASAVAIDGAIEPEQVAHGLRAYLKTFPQAGKALHVSPDQTAGGELSDAARRTVMVRAVLR